MRGNLFRLTSSDSMRARIQRDQIDQIIQQQKRQEIAQRDKFMSQLSLRHKQGKQPENSRGTALPLFGKKRPSPHRKARADVPTEGRHSLHQQIGYFSVKRHYQKIIGSVEDGRLARELKGQLQLPISPRNSPKQELRTTNYFQKVFSKQSRAQQYFESLRRSRRQLMEVEIQMRYE